MNLEGSLVKKSREKALVGTYILQQILQVFWRVFDKFVDVRRSTYM